MVYTDIYFLRFNQISLPGMNKLLVENILQKYNYCNNKNLHSATQIIYLILLGYY